jgi:FKBP-type peptidyl-prolyl cis-trans isomerase FkpA
MKLSFPLAAAFAVLLSLTACGGGGDSGSPATAVSSPAELKITDTVTGPSTNPEATSGSRVQVKYTGWLYSTSAADFKGTQFDATQPGATFTFVVGAVNTSESVILGFSQGVQGMKVGGKRTILVPSALGYGASGAAGGRIPPNSGLVFDVELVKVCGTAAC